MLKGIDVSHHQGAIDWLQVKAVGMQFAIIKATEGHTYADPRFASNIQGAQAAGLYTGAYHFMGATTVAEAWEEADFFLEKIKPFRFDMPVYLDFEDKRVTDGTYSYARFSKQLLTDIALAFLQRVQTAGYFVGIYTNPNWRTYRLEFARLSAFAVWLARYTGGTPETENLSSQCGIWQYSSTGKCAGITSTNVDLDVAYQDYPRIIEEAGLNGYPQTSTTIVQIDTTMDVPKAHGTYYTIKTTCLQNIMVTAGTGGVVTIVPLPRTGNDQLFAIVAIGQSGQKTGIFTAAPGEKPLKRFVFKIV